MFPKRQSEGHGIGQAHPPHLANSGVLAIIGEKKSKKKTMDPLNQSTPTTDAQPPEGHEDFLNPEALLSHLGVTKGMKVADMGCGTGYLSLPLAKHLGDDGRVFAMDIMKDALASISDRAMEQGTHNVQTVWCDLEMVGSSKIVENSVDLAIMANVYFQLEKPDQAILEAKRILKQDGQLVIVDWKPGAGPIGPPDDVRTEASQVSGVAVAAGFKPVREFEVDPYHYGLIFEQ